MGVKIYKNNKKQTEVPSYISYTKFISFYQSFHIIK